jgi:hypothetical protein
MRNANAYSYCDDNADCHPNGNHHTHCNLNADGQPDCDSYSQFHAPIDAHAESCANSTATPYTAPAPIEKSCRLALIRRGYSNYRDNEPDYRWLLLWPGALRCGTRGAS